MEALRQKKICSNIINNLNSKCLLCPYEECKEVFVDLWSLTIHIGIHV